MADLSADLSRNADQGAAPGERPLSPHIWHWRWQITMIGSIAHRMSGVGNALGTIVLAAWLISAAMGPNSYIAFQEAVSHPIGRVVLFGFTLSLVYHLLNGIRHLYWDAGKGFEPATARFTAGLTFVMSLLLSAAIWYLAYVMRGAAL